MSIRYKLVLCIVLSIVVLTIVLYGIATLVIFKSYLSIEKGQDTEHIIRVQQAIENYNVALGVKLGDWSHWDDVYTFTRGENAPFKDENLQSNALQTLEINSMVFLNTNAEVVFAKHIDLATGADLEPTAFTNQILVHRKVITTDAQQKSTSGLIKTDKGIVLLDSLPILHSDGSGPSAGSIIFARLLDPALLQNISDLTQLEINIYPYTDTALPDDVQTAKESFPVNETKLLIPLSASTMGGYALLKDIDGQPIGIAKVTLPRTIYSQAKNTLITFITASSLSILLFGIVIIYLIQRLIFIRLTRLNAEILKVNAQSDLRTAKVTEGTSDEVGTLARKINTMLEGLFTAQLKEREAYKLQLEASKLLHQQQKDTENMTRIMVEREIKMNELNKEIEALKGKIQ